MPFSGSRWPAGARGSPATSALIRSRSSVVGLAGPARPRSRSAWRTTCARPPEQPILAAIDWIAPLRTVPLSCSRASRTAAREPQGKKVGYASSWLQSLKSWSLRKSGAITILLASATAATQPRFARDEGREPAGSRSHPCEPPADHAHGPDRQSSSRRISGLARLADRASLACRPWIAAAARDRAKRRSCVCCRTCRDQERWR